MGKPSVCEDRILNHVVPCIASLAAAAHDDSLWKDLNYQILLKTRHENFKVIFSWHFFIQISFCMALVWNVLDNFSIYITTLFFNSLKVRIWALAAIDAFHKQLGEDYTQLVPETIPFMAELMEGVYTLLIIVIKWLNEWWIVGL